MDTYKQIYHNIFNGFVFIIIIRVHRTAHLLQHLVFATRCVLRFHMVSYVLVHVLQLVLGNLMGNDGSLCAGEWVISFCARSLSLAFLFFIFDSVDATAMRSPQPFSQKFMSIFAVNMRKQSY